LLQLSEASTSRVHARAVRAAIIPHAGTVRDMPDARDVLNVVIARSNQDGHC
jgi:hypothetical protein